MDHRSSLSHHRILSRTSTAGLSPKTPLDVHRQQTFTFGINRGPSRDYTPASRFAKQWHDRVNRKALCHNQFQAKATFKKAIKKIVSALKVINAFLSYSNSSSSRKQQDAFRYFLDILYINGNPENGSLGNDATAPTPLFDPAWFKANREIRLSSETKAILSQDPSSRTPEQVQTVFRCLHTLPSFAEYPLYHQKAICQVASYQSFPSNVTIVQQGHRADNLYFVLSGSATVISKQSLDGSSDAENGTNSVSVVKRGMTFDESAIMNNSRRNVTVISKTHIELLVVSRENYAKIFLGEDSESGKKEYISFLRTVDFLHDWPVDILESNPEHSQHCYFRRGTVIVRNSNSSPWLYVVKSGVCEVLIRLNTVKPGKVIGRNPRELSSLEALTKITLERRQEFRNTKNKTTEKNLPCAAGKLKIAPVPIQRHRRETLCYVPELDLVNSQTMSKHRGSAVQPKIHPIAEEDVFPVFISDDITRSSESSRSTTVNSLLQRSVSSQLPRINMFNNAVISTRRKSNALSVMRNVHDLSSSLLRRSFSLPSTSISGSELARLSKVKPAFVQIDLLHPKRVFGLSELDFEYNALQPGQAANVSLVSRGAECIMISKKFFMEHANALTKRWIRLNVQPYLPTEKHQQTLQEKIDWDAFKKKLVTSIVKEKTKTKRSFRNNPEVQPHVSSC